MRAPHDEVENLDTGFETPKLPLPLGEGRGEGALSTVFLEFHRNDECNRAFATNGWNAMRDSRLSASYSTGPTALFHPLCSFQSGVWRGRLLQFSP